MQCLHVPFVKEFLYLHLSTFFHLLASTTFLPHLLVLTLNCSEFSLSVFLTQLLTLLNSNLGSIKWCISSYLHHLSGHLPLLLTSLHMNCCHLPQLIEPSQLCPNHLLRTTTLLYSSCASFSSSFSISSPSSLSSSPSFLSSLFCASFPNQIQALALLLTYHLLLQRNHLLQEEHLATNCIQAQILL